MKLLKRVWQWITRVEEPTAELNPDYLEKPMPESMTPAPGGGWKTPPRFTPENTMMKGLPTARLSKMSAVQSIQTVAPLVPEHRERFERLGGPACIENGYKHVVRMENDLLHIVLEPGERRVVDEVTRQKFSRKGVGAHNMIEEWDPLHTLKDLIAEYERGQDPIARYNWSTTALVECSEMKAWRLRGQERESDSPHRPLRAS